MKTSQILAGVLLLVAAASIAMADKPRLAIQEIAATDAVLAQARSQGQLNVLEQIVQGSDAQLATTINQTKRFDIVARSKYKTILQEQGIATSGDVNPADPQTARAFMMAGAQYVATVTIDNFQDVTARMAVEGGFGTSKAERRTIQLQGTLQIFDTTTGVMLESVTFPLKKVATNELLPGETQEGRNTNALIGRITNAFATITANHVMDKLVPAKILAYTIGNITFNRGEGTGVKVDQIWQIFYPGEELIDPDTGESFGAEEIPIGWARVTAVLPKFSKAVAIQDFGINKKNIMRYIPEGLPANLDPNARSHGSATKTPAATPSEDTDTQSSRVPISEEPEIIPGSTYPPADALQSSQPITLALFVRDVSPEIPDAKVAVLEAYITSWLTDQHIAVINRAEVLNAVSGFAKEGPNAGTHDPLYTAAERLLSDESSAVALARNLGADGLLIATITSFDEDRTENRNPQRGNYDNVLYGLDVNWNVLNGGTGSSIVSGIAQAHQKIRQTPTQRKTFNVDSLLRENAQTIGKEVCSAMANPNTRRPDVESDLVPVEFRIAMADLSVPEIQKTDDGQYIIGANRYKLEPLACNVLVDGMLAGTAPGTITMTPGPHRIRIERPMIQPVDQFMVVKPGLSFVIPVALTNEGRRQWRENTLFFESLKTGAMLRDADLEKAKAFATYLRNSRMTIDLSNLRNFNTNTPTLWKQFLSDNE